MNETITTMPLLPLRGLVLYPDMILHFDLGRETSIRAAEYAMGHNAPVFLVAQRDIKDENPDIDALYGIGTCRACASGPASARQRRAHPCRGREPRAACRYHRGRAVQKAEVEILEATPAPIGSARTEALYRRVQEAFEEYSALAPRMTPEVVMNVLGAEDLGYLRLYCAKYADPLSGKAARPRAHRPHAPHHGDHLLLGEEIDILKIGQRISQKVKNQMEKNQRDYFLREQLRAIEEELGEVEEEEEDDNKFRERILALGLPQESEDHLLKEAKRLTRMQPSSPESNVIHTYLDTVLELPWNKLDRERADLKTRVKYSTATITAWKRSRNAFWSSWPCGS